MKVCIFFSIFPPRFGGGTIQGIELAKALLARGVDVFFVALTNDAGQKSKDEYEGIEVHYIYVKNLDRLIEGKSSLSEKLVLNLKLFAKFFALRKKYSIIHILTMVYPYTSLSLLARLLGKRIIAKTSMLQEVYFRDTGRIFGRINKSCADRMHRLITISSMIQDALMKEGFDESRVLFIPNGVDTGRFTPLPPGEKEGLKNRLDLGGGSVVSFVGGITYRKGIDRLVSIWPEIVNRYPANRLVLVGPRSESEGVAGDRFCLEEVQGMIDALKLGDYIRFTGKVGNVVEYLQVSDLFVFPSTMEGMPNVILEAMSCGVPAVSYRVSGVDDIMEDGQSGRIIEPGDERAFLAAVMELLGDEEKRKYLSSKARERIVSRFSLESIADRYIQVYNSIT